MLGLTSEFKNEIVSALYQQLEQVLLQILQMLN